MTMLTPAPGDTLADSIASAARAFDPAKPITFLGHFGDDDAYHRGRALIVVPGIWTGMPPSLLATVRARRACSVTGRCSACGACVELATGTFAHESDCQVTDDHLAAALYEWARQVGAYARGRRIQEIPA